MPFRANGWPAATSITLKGVGVRTVRRRARPAAARVGAQRSITGRSARSSIAARTLRRIAIASSSRQSCRTDFSMYASAFGGAYAK